MKNIKKLFSLFLITGILFGCISDDDNVDFVDSAVAPSNLALLFEVTQDNTGLVTITPNAEGATNFDIYYGDSTADPVNLMQGENTSHVYAEGTYTVKLVAHGLTGLEAEITEQLVVSFIAPQNLVVSIENDAAVSKQVNVVATADYAITYEVDFGDGSTPLSANIGDGISYIYENPGVYTITVTAMGAAIETTTYTEDFEVTAILQPLGSAPTPPARADEDVISIFSAAYNDEPGADYFPDWGQGGCCGSGWTMFDLNGDEMLQYTNLSYQGNQFGAAVDVSQMEYIHLDVWTADVLQNIEVSLISISNGERPVTVPLTPNAWTSIDIPITDYTDQSGFTVTDIHQLKYVGDPFAGGGTAFIDNIYFYRAPSASNTLEGTWVMAPEAGALGVGPAPGDTGWWNCDASCVTARACYYDDEYVFGSDGSFSNVLGTDTWIEGWQGGSDACGTPVAPHDGSAVATYTYDAGAGTVTINGAGAYIGLPKANNQGELPNVAVPSSITYNVTFLDTDTISVIIEAGAGVFWQYKLVRI